MTSEADNNGLDRTESFAMLARGTVISHYEIIEKVGEGGMGVVCKARDTKLGRTVALKFLPPHLICDSEVKARFEHEAKAASALNHNNITTIHDVDEIKGQCFICMEYIDGKSLKELIREQALSVDKVAEIALQIGEGLNAAHKKDIVHRDVKSDNIMLTAEGVVKITDFGLAKLKGATKLTRTGTTMGTLQYMSPEQAQGMEVDQRSDIFSFGVILYEMITGQLPFKGEHEAAVIHSIVNQTPEPLARYKANVPEGLQRIVDKALEKDVSTRYQSAAEVVADLKGLQKETRVVIAAKPKSKLLAFVIPASVVFVIALFFLILRPFEVQLVPEKSAIAKENSLAIMYFDNLMDTEDKDKLGEIVTNLLITDLSESEYLKVLSSQRLHDILKLLGREGEKVIDRTVASEVAIKANAKWMLLGSILQIVPEMVLTSQLVDVATGRVVASQRITGEAGEDLFSMVDKLTIEIKGDLALPLAAREEQDPSVADVTTHSPEAYRHYLEGVDHHFRYYTDEAERSFRKALEFDSTFAMAYYWLAASKTGPEAAELSAKAVKYSNQVSRKERHYIRVQAAVLSRDFDSAFSELRELVRRYPDDKYAFFTLGLICTRLPRLQEAVINLSKAIELDSLYKRAYNQLAYAYHRIGAFDESIWAINKYISLAPDEANPYDSRADLYAYNGKIDEAIESYTKALEIKPDFYESLRKLGHMYLFKREYARAESCYKALASSHDKDRRSRGRTCLALIPLYQGKFQKALMALDDGIAADRMEEARAQQDNKHFLKAAVYRERENLSLALGEVQTAFEISRAENPGSILYWRHYYAQLLAENNDFEKADEVAKSLKKDVQEKDRNLMPYCWWASGCIEFSKGNLEASLAYHEKAAVQEPPSFYECFMHVNAYLASGRLGEAVTLLEKMLSRYDETRASAPISAVKAYYLLGSAYEKSGWNQKAIEKYEEFLEIWKHADPGIPEVEDAQERLDQLRKKA